MKAIQIKYLPCTNTKPARLKAWTSSNVQLIVSRNSSLDISVENESFALAQALIDKMVESKYWNKQTVITGFGCLPNGDYVATLGE